MTVVMCALLLVGGGTALADTPGTDVIVSPDQNLNPAGHLVDVSGTGFGPNGTGAIQQCILRDAVTEDCSNNVGTFTTGNTGLFGPIKVTVSESFTAGGAPATCSIAQPCTLFAQMNAQPQNAHQAITFAPATFSISDVTLAEGDSGTTAFSFTITRSASAGASSVQWSTANGSAIAPSDYTAVLPTTASFATGELTKTVVVNVNGDTAVEANDGFTVNLTNPVGATIADGTGVGRIVNDDSATFSVNDVTLAEGNSGTKAFTFTITRSGDTGGSASVVWRTYDIHATSGSDYVAVAPTTLNFLAGDATKAVSVTVNGDIALENNENFYVRLASPVGASIADGSGVGMITNDDAPPPASSFSIGDATVVEGDLGTVLATFTVTRSGPTATPATVQWFTANGTATAAGDYVPVSPTTLTFAPGDITKNVSVTVNGDTAVEPNESFLVRLGSPTGGATIADPSGLGRITNDDAAAFSVNDVINTEGNAGTTAFSFTVTRSGDVGGTATVQWSTANGTATAAGGDYVAVPLTTLTFSSGQTAKTVTVAVNGDRALEGDETFRVVLSSPVGAALFDASGLGRIINDD